MSFPISAPLVRFERLRTPVARTCATFTLIPMETFYEGRKGHLRASSRKPRIVIGLIATRLQ